MMPNLNAGDIPTRGFIYATSGDCVDLVLGAKSLSCDRDLLAPGLGRRGEPLG